MKVWNYLTHSEPDTGDPGNVPDIMKLKFIDKGISLVFKKYMGEFFADKNYGNGVKEIFYRELCLREDHKRIIETYYSYTKRNKTITGVIELDFNTSLNLDPPELAKYIANLYLERSEDFASFEIKDFDCSSFIKDLRSFFIEKEIT